MTFICTIDPEHPNFHIIIDGQAAVVVTRIDYDPSLPADWALDIGFDIAAGGAGHDPNEPADRSLWQAMAE